MRVRAVVTREQGQSRDVTVMGLHVTSSMATFVGMQAARGSEIAYMCSSDAPPADSPPLDLDQSCSAAVAIEPRAGWLRTRTASFHSKVVRYIYCQGGKRAS